MTDTSDLEESGRENKSGFVSILRYEVMGDKLKSVTKSILGAI